MVVALETGPELTIGEPEALLPAPSEVACDASPDAQRFLMSEEEPKPRQIHIVLNWFEELKRLVPTN
jgi:hypothetical protein